MSLNLRGSAVTLLLATTVFSTGHASASWPQSPALTMPLSTGFGLQESGVCSDGSGGVYAFHEAPGAGGNIVLRVQRYSAGGVSYWGGDGVQVTQTGFRPKQIHMFEDINNGCYLIWLDSRSGKDQVHLQRLSPEGQIRFASGGAPISLANTNVSQLHAVSDNNGGVHIGFLAERKIFAFRYDASGNRLFSATVATITENESDLKLDNLQSTPAGGCYLAYIRSFSSQFAGGLDEDVFVRGIDASGNMTPECAVATSRNDENDAQIAVLNGQIICSYTAHEPAAVVYAISFSGTLTSTLWDRKVIAQNPTYAAAHPVLTAIPGHRGALLVWQVGYDWGVDGRPIEGKKILPSGDIAWHYKLGTSSGPMDVKCTSDGGFYLNSNASGKQLSSRYTANITSLWVDKVVASATSAKFSLSTGPSLALNSSDGVYVALKLTEGNVADLSLTQLQANGSLGGDVRPDLVIVDSDAALLGKKNSGKMYGGVWVRNVGGSASTPALLSVGLTESPGVNEGVIFRVADIPMLQPGETTYVTPGYLPPKPVPPPKPGKKAKKPKKPKQLKFKLPKNYNISGKSLAFTADSLNYLYEASETNNQYVSHPMP